MTRGPAPVWRGLPRMRSMDLPMQQPEGRCLRCLRRRINGPCRIDRPLGVWEQLRGRLPGASRVTESVGSGSPGGSPDPAWRSVKRLPVAFGKRPPLGHGPAGHRLDKAVPAAWNPLDYWEVAATTGRGDRIRTCDLPPPKRAL